MLKVVGLTGARVNMGQSSLVSVVTPFHNTVDYLEQCINSVLSQSHGAFEYLLCDNCSTDGSTEIAETYAARDSRIRFMRFEELLPQVANYNRALEHVTPDAEWCKIVQADDWLYESCLERMIHVGNLDEDIGLVSSYYLKGNTVRGYGLPIETQVFDGKEACRYQLRDRIFFMGSPTAVMYRMSVVRSRQPFYALNRYHEDTEAAYEILEHHKLGFVHEVLTSLRVGNPSTLAGFATFNFPALDFLIVLRRYAHRFLPQSEAESLVRRATREYYRFLGESVLQLRSREFWDYHRVGLSTVEQSVAWRRTALGALRAAAFVLLNPLSTLQSIWHRVRRRLSNRAPLL
jgi:glycosyltransferase involved in cell wall biosynthesis